MVLGPGPAVARPLPGPGLALARPLAWQRLGSGLPRPARTSGQYCAASFSPPRLPPRRLRRPARQRPGQVALCEQAASKHKVCSSTPRVVMCASSISHGENYARVLLPLLKRQLLGKPIPPPRLQGGPEGPPTEPCPSPMPGAQCGAGSRCPVPNGRRPVPDRRADLERGIQTLRGASLGSQNCSHHHLVAEPPYASHNLRNRKATTKPLPSRTRLARRETHGKGTFPTENGGHAQVGRSARADMHKIVHHACRANTAVYQRPKKRITAHVATADFGAPTFRQPSLLSVCTALRS